MIIFNEALHKICLLRHIPFRLLLAERTEPGLQARSIFKQTTAVFIEWKRRFCFIFVNNSAFDLTDNRFSIIIRSKAYV